MFVLILIFAIAVRVFLFTFDKSLWLDEAAIALNVIDKGCLELFLPLNYAQSAPPLYLSLIKFLTSMFGYGEKVLRFIPFISSVASVFAFYYLSKTLFNTENKLHKAVMVAVLLCFGLSYHALYNTIEFKPYSVDILCVISVFLIYFKYLNNPQMMQGTKKQVCLGVFFALLPLFSFGSIFALITVSIMMLILSRGKKFTVPCIFTLALVLEYFLFFKNNHAGRIYEYWAPYFINFSPGKVLSVFVDLFKYYFYPSRFILFAIILFILGGIYLYKNKREVFYPFALIIFGAFLASFLNIYPLSDRLSFFLYPVFLLVILFGILSAGCYKNLFAKAVVCTLSAFFIFGSVFYNFLNPGYYIREDIKPLLIRLQEEIQPDDKIFVYKHSHLAYRYYNRFFNFKNETFVCSPKMGKECMPYAEAFCKGGGCYIIYTTEINFPKNIQKLNAFMEENNGNVVLKSGHTAYLFKIPKAR